MMIMLGILVSQADMEPCVLNFLHTRTHTLQQEDTQDSGNSLFVFWHAVFGV